MKPRYFSRRSLVIFYCRVVLGIVRACRGEAKAPPVVGEACQQGSEVNSMPREKRRHALNPLFLSRRSRVFMCFRLVLGIVRWCTEQPEEAPPARRRRGLLSGLRGQLLGDVRRRYYVKPRYLARRNFRLVCSHVRVVTRAPRSVYGQWKTPITL